MLHKNVKYHWTTQCKGTFLKMKYEIIRDRLLTPYNPGLLLMLTCNANPFGIISVLSHSIDRVEKATVFMSRSLTSTERNYSQLDQEALTIIL